MSPCYNFSLHRNFQSEQVRGCTGSVIETYHLSKLYSRGVYALHDLSLTIDKGDFVFLTGPSGAGKSTFLRLLLRAEMPSEGTLKVGGRDLQTLSAPEVQAYRRTVGFIFQDHCLLPQCSVLENVLTPTLVATHTYVNPIIAVLFGWWFAAEHVSFNVLLSAAMVVGAVFLVDRGMARLKS